MYDTCIEQAGIVFLPGNKGRPKGSKNKVTTVREILEQLGFDPIKHLVEIIPELRPKEQAQYSVELAKFVYPSVKQLELSGEVGLNNQGPVVQIVLPSNGREDKKLVAVQDVTPLPVLPVVKEDHDKD